MKRSTYFIIFSLFLILAVVLPGCSKSSDMIYEEKADYSGNGVYTETEEMAVMEMPAEADYEDYSRQSASVNGQSISIKIIKNLSLDLRVKDMDAAEDAIMSQVEAYGGYVANYSKNEYDATNVSVYINAKIPSDKLDEMQDWLDSAGEVKNSNLYTQDITDQYYDIQARLKHAEAQEEKYLEILDAAETTEDILLVMEQIDIVQERIEQFEGSIKMWDQLVDYSEVNISLYPEAALIEDDDEGRFITIREVLTGIRNGLRGGARFIVNALGYILIVLGYILVPALILAIIIVPIIIIAKRRRKKRPSKEKKPLVAKPSDNE